MDIRASRQLTKHVTGDAMNNNEATQSKNTQCETNGETLISAEQLQRIVQRIQGCKAPLAFRSGDPTQRNHAPQHKCMRGLTTQGASQKGGRGYIYS